MQDRDQPPPEMTREERIAYNESWSRTRNEQRAQAWGGPDPVAGFRCECWQSDCTERIRLSREDWDEVRAQPNRFAVAPDHVAHGFEAVIVAKPHYWLVEKFGQAGEIAAELAAE